MPGPLTVIIILIIPHLFRRTTGIVDGIMDIIIIINTTPTMNTTGTLGTISVTFMVMDIGTTLMNTRSLV